MNRLVILVCRLLRVKRQNQLLFGSTRELFNGVFALAGAGAVSESFAINQAYRPTMTRVTRAFVAVVFTIMFSKTTV